MPRANPGRRILISALSTLMALSMGEGVFAQEQAVQRDLATVERTIRGNAPLLPSEVESQREEGFTSDLWPRQREWAERNGLLFEAVYKGDINSNLAGGVERKIVFMGNLDVKLTVDGEKSLGWKGATFFVYGLFNHGGLLSPSVGDLQVTNNIEVQVETGRLYEAWWQQAFFDEKLSLLLGIHDLNAEFYVTESSLLFLNSSFGVGSELALTGQLGPSIFPYTSLSARARFEPDPSVYVMIAAFDAVSGDPSSPAGTDVRFGKGDGVLAIAEAGYYAGKTEEKHDAKVGVGVWQYSADSNPEGKTNQGAYFIFEHHLSEDFSYFARAGFADSSVNQIASNIVLGFEQKGMFTSRPEDKFGLGLTVVYNSDDYIDRVSAEGAQTERSESAFEMTYAFDLGKGLSLQPDIQYVANPGTDPTLENAWVGILRFGVVF